MYFIIYSFKAQDEFRGVLCRGKKDGIKDNFCCVNSTLRRMKTQPSCLIYAVPTGPSGKCVLSYKVMSLKRSTNEKSHKDTVN